MSPLLLLFSESHGEFVERNLRCSCLLDDILITGKTDKDHLKSLDEVLNWLETAGLRLKKQKCHFLCNSVVYLGHHIDASGLSPCAEKVQAVRDALTPTSVSELKSFFSDS